MTRIDHVNVVVQDMERSVRFYSETLQLRRGFEVMLEGEWIEQVTGLSGVCAHCVFMEAQDGGARLELLQYLTPDPVKIEANRLPSTGGLRHLAFLVEDIDEFTNRLQRLGVTPLSAPVEVPFAVGAMGRKRLCYFHDPDGTLLEVAAYEALS